MYMSEKEATIVVSRIISAPISMEHNHGASEWNKNLDR